MFKDAKVGDRVWHISQGWGEIDEIKELDGYYPICVNGDTFTLDGKMFSTDISPTLFWNEVKFDIPSRPLPKLEVDTKVVVWDYANTGKKRRHFSHFDNDGNIYVFKNGLTSFSIGSLKTECIIKWNNWELYDETKDNK